MEDRTRALKAVFPGAVGLAAMLPRFARLLAALFRDARVPLYLKLLTAGAVTYVALPIDALPDFVPTAGKLDDLLVIFLVLEKYLKSCPREVFEEHWDAIMGDNYEYEQAAREAMEELDPLVADRFALLKEWITGSAGRIASAARSETGAARPASTDTQE